MSVYCDLVKTLESDHPHKVYHDNEYGFPIFDDNELFGRLILEINQAGLNWLTILKKKDAFRVAFADFDIKKIANFGEADIEILMNNKAIIRNRKKIEAVIYNANVLIDIQHEHDSFYNWIEKNAHLKIDEWTILFKKKFKFTGKLIIEEFLMSIGVLKGAHIESCPIFKLIIKKEPLWSKK